MDYILDILLPKNELSKINLSELLVEWEEKSFLRILLYIPIIQSYFSQNIWTKSIIEDFLEINILWINLLHYI